MSVVCAPGSKGAIIGESHLVLSEAEKSKCSLLIVEPDLRQRHQMRGALASLGYGAVQDAASYDHALERVAQDPITHLIVEVGKPSGCAKEFTHKVLQIVPDMVVIPASSQPQIDDVFDFLILGARGFIVKPFTTDTLDYTIVVATKSDSLADETCERQDRNRLLAAVVVRRLDKVANLLKQARQFDTAMREVPRMMALFRKASHVARLYAKDGEVGLLEALENLCVGRAEDASSPTLGRIGKRVKVLRQLLTTTDDKAGQP